MVLAVAMGVGRFAYTPLLPAMQAGAGLSHAMAGYIASANLTGYLIGALGASSAALRHKRLQAVWYALTGVIATTALMSISVEWVWMLARFLTGIASGFAFVLGSSIVLDRAVAERRLDWIAIFYTGVGLGIALTGVAVPPLTSLAGWRAGWLGLAVISLILCAITIPWLSDRTAADASQHDDVVPTRYPPLYWWLLGAYGAEGMGYIIPATFMVAMIAATSALARYAAASWIVVGLVALPSTVIWNRLGMWVGRDRALAIATLVMGIGVVAPIALPNAVGVALAAITLGGTFLGITALANALGRELQPRSSHVAIGRLTASFGVGQIVGPAVAGVLVSATGSYAPALLVAAGVLFAGAVVMFCGSSLSAPIRSETF